MKTDIFYHRVRIRMRTANVHSDFEAIIVDNTLGRIQSAISKSGFLLDNAEITQIEKPTVKLLFVPLRTLKKFCIGLVYLRQRLDGYEEMLKLNTFDPELWRQQLIENSRNKDLSQFRTKIHSLIRERYGLLR